MSTNPAFDTQPPRKKGRYDSAAQIEKKIDEAQNEAAELNRRADALDAEADEGRIAKRSGHWIADRRQDAAKLREQARRKIEVRCKFLKEKLAAFLTESLPFSEPELRVKSLPKVGSDKFSERSQR